MNRKLKKSTEINIFFTTSRNLSLPYFGLYNQPFYLILPDIRKNYFQANDLQ